MLTLHAKNFRALRHLCWPLAGVSVLTGANGSGKTTALFALRLLRTAFDRGLPEAVSLVLGGSYNLRNRDAGDDAIELGFDLGALSWRVRLLPRGPTVDHVTDEWLARGDEVIFRRDSLGNCTYRGQRAELGASFVEQLGLRWASAEHPEDDDVSRIVEAVRRIQVFFDPDLRSLRSNASRATENRHLSSSSRNVLTMLQKWKNRRQDLHRYEFVHQGLRAAFPGVYEGLDLEGAQTIAGMVYRPGDEMPGPISHESNGVLSMMMLLAQVASAEPGGLVATDEPENAQHPFAIREFAKRARAWAQQHEITLAFTTHSPVLINEFQSEPERVFVLERGQDVSPQPLDALRTREWLQNFMLGDLYVQGEFAANESVLLETER